MAWGQGIAEFDHKLSAIELPRSSFPSTPSEKATLKACVLRLKSNEMY